MHKVFEKYNDDNYHIYLWQCMKRYQESGVTFANEKLVYSYLMLVIHYIFVTRKKEEQTAESLYKIVGASYREGNMRSPFFLLLEKWITTGGKDDFLKEGIKLEIVVTNEDIDEIFDFFEWDVRQYLVEEEKYLSLGQICFCKVAYLTQKGRFLTVTRTKRESEDLRELYPDWMNKCEQFVKDYTPEKIKTYLDEYVIGQDEAKISLCNAIYNHYQRIVHPEENLMKTNVILIGPSGCGKTELIRRIRDLVNIPVVISDFSGVVATPWKGRNKEEALLNLYLKAAEEMPLAEYGIVFLDEFDKIVPVRGDIRKGDINHELQGQVLGMMEGTMMDIPYPVGHGTEITLKMNTHNILFICAGAFEGLDKIVAKDRQKEGTLGFCGKEKPDFYKEFSADQIKIRHLMEYGMKAELAGRIGEIAVLKALDKDILKRILKEAKDSVLVRYQKEFLCEDQVQLTFTEEALDAIVEKVSKMKIGARGLNAVLHEILEEALFVVPDMSGVKEVVITKDAANLTSGPEYR